MPAHSVLRYMTIVSQYVPPPHLAVKEKGAVSRALALKEFVR